MPPFTVAQANQMLPLVRRIVEDIVSQHRLWREKVLELDLLASARRAGESGGPAEALEREVQELARDIDDCQRELEELGVLLKDRRVGLADFPAELDGRPILLCWRLGEPSVQYWHELDGGFAGRQLLQSPPAVGV